MHIPVLLEESIKGLDLKNKKYLIDGTLGLGGHSKYALSLYKNLHLIGIDQDEDNLKKAKINLKEYKDRITLIKDNFENLDQIVERLNLVGKIDSILLDLGLASTHIDIDERGFSFRQDGPLDMRMDKDKNLTAEIIINTYSENDLIKIFKEYGEELRARAIANEIVKYRKNKKISTTNELVEIIKKVKKDSDKHPAKLVFQALRIEVNNEIETLKKALNSGIRLLSKGGRIAVISYHSLEDRIVKHIFKDETNECICPKYIPICQCKKIRTLEIITKKPIIADDKEVEENPRSRSAKLRIAQKII